VLAATLPSEPAPIQAPQDVAPMDVSPPTFRRPGVIPPTPARGVSAPPARRGVPPYADPSFPCYRPCYSLFFQEQETAPNTLISMAFLATKRAEQRRKKTWFPVIPQQSRDIRHMVVRYQGGNRR